MKISHYFLVLTPVLLVLICVHIYISTFSYKTHNAALHSIERISIQRGDWKKASDAFTHKRTEMVTTGVMKGHSRGNEHIVDIEIIRFDETINKTIDSAIGDTIVNNQESGNDKSIDDQPDPNNENTNIETEVHIDSSSQSNTAKRFVFMDWPLNSDLLAYYNYKSLESFLVNSYTSDTYIEIMILGNRVADYYKVDNLIRSGMVHMFCRFNAQHTVRNVTVWPTYFYC